MNLVFLPLKSLILTTIFNVCFRTDTSHLKLISLSDFLSFSHTNSFLDYFSLHLRLQFSKKKQNSPISFLYTYVFLVCCVFFLSFFLFHFHFLCFWGFISCLRESFSLFQFKHYLLRRLGAIILATEAFVDCHVKQEENLPTASCCLSHD